MVYQIFVLFTFIMHIIFICFVFSVIRQSHTQRKYSDLAFSNTLGLYPKSSPVQYSYFSKRSSEDKADILAASLFKLYWA